MGSAGPNVLPVCWIDDTLVFYGMGNLMSDDLNAVGLLGAVTVSKSTLNDRTRVELTNPRVEVVCSLQRSGKFNVLAMTDVNNQLYRRRYEEIADVLHSMDDSIRLGGMR